MNQRELSSHTHSFTNALRSALRGDPDAIQVGEMRDRETIQLTIKAVETGHQVFGTLQSQIPAQFSDSVGAIVALSLRKKRRRGRIAAVEILIRTPAVCNLIGQEQVHQIPSALKVGRKSGVQTMDMALIDLVNRRVVTPEEAQVKSLAPYLMSRSVAGNMLNNENQSAPTNRSKMGRAA